MEVHFQFNGKEYADSIIRNYITSKEFKKNFIIKVIIYVALILLSALRIRYRTIRYSVFIVGFVGLFFIRKITLNNFKKELYKSHRIKNDDIRVMNIKLEENFLTVGEIMEERKYSYDAVQEAYVIGEYLYIKFIKNDIAFVHSRAFRDADCTKAFVTQLENKANIKVYRKNNVPLKTNN